MLLFLTGLILFVGGHLLMALRRDLRDKLVSKLGRVPYMGAYSVVALCGLVLIVMGWPSAPADSLYALPAAARTATLILMWPALVLLVAAYAPAGRIASLAQHPMLAAVKIWAFAHLLANGEIRSLLLFGSLLAFAVIDRILVKRRGDVGRRGTSIVGDGMAVVIGTGAYVVIYTYLHPHIAGVAL